MNGQFQVAQASGTGNSNNATPPRIFKLTKPLGDQAVVVNLGYDQKVQVDFSAIANEKITLLHVGEKLIILFDNQSTVTVEPFFDSRHDALNNLTIEVAPGRDLSVSEFASSFPISTDQSVLPAAGNGNGNAQASGANFGNPAVDPLPPIPTNILAPPEVLPNFNVTVPTGFIPLIQPTIPSTGPTITINGTLALTLSETDLTAATNNGINGSAHNLALTSATGNFAGVFTDTAGSAAITSVVYALSITGGNGTASGLIDSQTGLKDVLVLNGNTIEGHVGATGGPLAFTIALNPTTGVVTFTEDRAVDQTQVSNTNLAQNIIAIASNVVELTQTVTDGNGATASASLDLGPKLSITDDGPSVTVVNGDSEVGNTHLTLSEQFLTVATNGVDGTLAGTGPTSKVGHFGGAFVDVSGADGIETTAYSLSAVNGTSSGLVDSQTQQNDVLVQVNATTIEGHVNTTGGLLAFTISVDPSSGDVTFTEDRAVDNNATGSASLSSNVVTLTQTVTDNDGTHASASIDLGTQLSISDDGPHIATTNTVAAVTLSEQFLTAATNGVAGTLAGTGPTSKVGHFGGDFTDTFGADSGAVTTLNPTPVAYSLSITGFDGVHRVDSGLVDSQTGTHDLLFQSGNTITGFVGATNTVAFTITVDPSSGDVTFTEKRAVVQAQDGSDPSGTLATLTANLVSLTQTITDSDGTHTSASIDLGTQLSISDDGPHITAVQNAIIPALANTDVQGTWQPAFGADGQRFAPAGDALGANDPAFAAIGIAVGPAPAGLTYTVIDTGTHNLNGEEVFSVAVTGGAQAYNFFEYTHYDASTHTAELFAYTDQADAVNGHTDTTNQFFTLSLAANGTYDFHLTSIAGLTSTVTTSFTGGGNSGEGNFADVTAGAATFVKTGAPPLTPGAGVDLVIDGFNASDPHTFLQVHANNNGFGIANGNFETNQVLNFEFAQSQSAVDLGIGKGNNGVNEHFLITLFDSSHHAFATEDIILPDGQTVLIDSAHFGFGEAPGAPTTGTFGAFSSVTVENIAGANGSTGDDDKLNLTSVSFNEHTTISSTTLNFTPTITDGDGDSASTSLSVALNGTSNNGSFTLTGTGNDVLLSGPVADTINLSGNNNTIQYNHLTDGGGTGVGTGDTVNGFNGTDSISVSAAGFGGGLTFGDVFIPVSNTTGQFDNSGTQRFVFDTTNHTLFYSADGTTTNEHAIAIVNLAAALNPTVHVGH